MHAQSYYKCHACGLRHEQTNHILVLLQFNVPGTCNIMPGHSSYLGSYEVIMMCICTNVSGGLQSVTTTC